MNAIRMRGWLLVAIQAALLAVLIAGRQANLWKVGGPLGTAGNLLRLIGLATIASGAIELGRAASVHPEPTRRGTLKRRGLYRLARHPIYTGVIIFSAGVTLTSASVRAVGAFAALIVLLNIKARFEEQLLAARFPEYEAYAQRTPRFVPGARVRASPKGRPPVNPNPWSTKHRRDERGNR